MDRTTRRTALFRAVAIVLSLPLAAAALAQEPPASATTPATGAAAPSGQKTTELETVSVLGSRRVGRSSDTSTPVPVDVIPMAKPAEQGAQFDLAQTLQYPAPSFNSTRQTGADGPHLSHAPPPAGPGAGPRRARTGSSTSHRRHRPPA